MEDSLLHVLKLFCDDLVVLYMLKRMRQYTFFFTMVGYEREITAT